MAWPKAVSLFQVHNPVHHRCAPQVDENYLLYLMELDKKLKYAHEDEVARASAAKRDLEPALERLRVKALAKVGLVWCVVCVVLEGWAGGAGDVACRSRGWRLRVHEVGRGCGTVRAGGCACF